MTVAQIMDNMPSWELTYWQALMVLRDKERKQRAAIEKGVDAGAQIVARRRSSRWRR